MKDLPKGLQKIAKLINSFDNEKFSVLLYKIAAQLTPGKKRFLLQRKELRELPEEDQKEFSEWIEKVDPTPKGKYSEFLTKIYLQVDQAQRERYLKEDVRQIKEDLKQFEDLKRRNKIPAIEKNPETLNQLLETIEKYSEVKSKREIKKEVKAEGVQLVLDQVPYKIYKVTNPDACVLMAKGSKWCVSQKAQAKNYLKEGPLYFIIKNNQKHALFHYESNQFMNVLDQPLEKTEKWKLFKILEPISGKDIFYNQLNMSRYFRDHNIRSRWPEAEKILLEKYPDYIAGSNSYMELTDMHERWPEAERAILDKSPKFIVDYIKQVKIKERWAPAEEVLLAKNPKAIPSYMAQIGMKERWPEAEKVLFEKAPRVIPNYMGQIGMKERWPEAEKAILEKAPEAISFYMDQIGMKERWPEAEKVLFEKGPDLLPQYMQLAQMKERWPAAEKAFLENYKKEDFWTLPFYMDLMDMHERWPEAEKVFLENSDIDSWIIGNYLNKVVPFKHGLTVDPFRENIIIPLIREIESKLPEYHSYQHQRHSLKKETENMKFIFEIGTEGLYLFIIGENENINYEEELVKEAQRVNQIFNADPNLKGLYFTDDNVQDNSDEGISYFINTFPKKLKEMFFNKISEEF